MNTQKDINESKLKAAEDEKSVAKPQLSEQNWLLQISNTTKDDLIAQAEGITTSLQKIKKQLTQEQKTEQELIKSLTDSKTKLQEEQDTKDKLACQIEEKTPSLKQTQQQLIEDVESAIFLESNFNSLS